MTLLNVCVLCVVQGPLPLPWYTGVCAVCVRVYVRLSVSTSSTLQVHNLSNSMYLYVNMSTMQYGVPTIYSFVFGE